MGLSVGRKVHGVRTLFNNDLDNSSGLNVGTDQQYIETHYGKLIDAKGIKARYVRLYSNGCDPHITQHVYNGYVEVEVFGLPGD